MIFQLWQNDETGIYFLFDCERSEANLSQEQSENWQDAPYSFKHHGTHAEEFASVLAALKEIFEAQSAIGIPPADDAANQIRAICDQDLVFEAIASRAKKQPGNLSAKAELTRLKIRDSGKKLTRVILADDIAATGETLQIYSQLLMQHATTEIIPSITDVICFAIGHCRGPKHLHALLYLPSIAEDAGLCDLTELSELLGIGPRRIQILVKEKILPAPDRHRYEKDECVKAYIEYLRNSNQRTPTDHKAEMIRLTKEKADAQALKNAVTRGQLLPVEQVAEIWAGHIAAAQTKLLGLPAKLSPEIAFLSRLPEIQNLLRAAINEVLTDLAASNIEPPGNG